MTIGDAITAALRGVAPVTAKRPSPPLTADATVGDRHRKLSLYVDAVDIDAEAQILDGSESREFSHAPILPRVLGQDDAGRAESRDLVDRHAARAQDEVRVEHEVGDLVEQVVDVELRPVGVAERRP